MKKRFGLLMLTLTTLLSGCGAPIKPFNYRQLWSNIVGKLNDLQRNYTFSIKQNAILAPDIKVTETITGTVQMTEENKMSTFRYYNVSTAGYRTDNMYESMYQGQYGYYMGDDAYGRYNNGKPFIISSDVYKNPRYFVPEVKLDYLRTLKMNSLREVKDYGKYKVGVSGDFRNGEDSGTITFMYDYQSSWIYDIILINDAGQYLQGPQYPFEGKASTTAVWVDKETTFFTSIEFFKEVLAASLPSWAMVSNKTKK